MRSACVAFVVVSRVAGRLPGPKALSHGGAGLGVECEERGSKNLGPPAFVPLLAVAHPLLLRLCSNVAGAGGGRPACGEAWCLVSWLGLDAGACIRAIMELQSPASLGAPPPTQDLLSITGLRSASSSRTGILSTSVIQL